MTLTQELGVVVLVITGAFTVLVMLIRAARRARP